MGKLFARLVANFLGVRMQVETASADVRWPRWEQLVYASTKDARQLDNPPRASVNGQLEGSCSGCTASAPALIVFSAAKRLIPGCQYFMDAGHGIGHVTMWASYFFSAVYGVEVHPHLEMPLYSSLQRLVYSIENDEQCDDFRQLLPRLHFTTANLKSYRHFEPIQVMYCNLEGLARNDWMLISPILDRTKTLQVVIMASTYLMTDGMWTLDSTFRSTYGNAKIWFRSLEIAQRNSLENTNLASSLPAELLPLPDSGPPSFYAMSTMIWNKLTGLLHGVSGNKRKRGRPSKVMFLFFSFALLTSLQTCNPTGSTVKHKTDGEEEWSPVNSMTMVDIDGAILVNIMIDFQLQLHPCVFLWIISCFYAGRTKDRSSETESCGQAGV